MSVGDKSEKAKEIVNTQLEQEIWPQIVNISDSIWAETSSVGREVEITYQNELMRIRAKIHYTAK